MYAHPYFIHSKDEWNHAQNISRKYSCQASGRARNLGLLYTTVEKSTGRSRAMIGENRLSLRINRLKSKTAWKLPIIFEEFIEYTPIFWRKSGRCQHVTGWTCKHSDLNRFRPKSLAHWSRVLTQDIVYLRQGMVRRRKWEDNKIFYSSSSSPEVKFIVRGFEDAQETWLRRTPLLKSVCHIGILVIFSSMYNGLHQRTLEHTINHHRTRVLLSANQILKLP